MPKLTLRCCKREYTKHGVTPMPRKMPRKDLIFAWALPTGVVVIATLALLFGDEAITRLRYDRTGIAGGEYYRLLSAHFVHLGIKHFILNAAGLMLVWYLVGAAFPATAWCLTMASAIMFIDLGFWIGMPELEWYVGLSGVLHGMLAAGVPGIWQNRRTEACLIGAALVAKLGYESLFGPLPGSENTAGGAVITEAHLFGAIGGFVVGLLYSIRARPTAPI